METLHYVPITDISPNPYQPRRHFDQEKLEELAQSIATNGIIQPLIVRKSAIIGYELLAGERRLRASQLAGLETVPVVIKQLTDEDLLTQAIIENLQRADLTPIEEAKSYQKLLQKQLTHEEIAKLMGKSRPYISNMLRLLSLSAPLIQAVEEGVLSSGHARLLVPLSAAKQEEWLATIIQQQLSVRQLEKLLTSKQKPATNQNNHPFVKEKEKELSQLLGTRVQIHEKKKGKGEIVIPFSSHEEFEQIINTFSSLSE